MAIPCVATTRVTCRAWCAPRSNGKRSSSLTAGSGRSRMKRSADESQALGRDMTQESIQVLDDNAGERMVPEVSGGMTFWEHVHRYAFACRFVAGKRVLDIASGEGYGAAALQKAGAAHVIGVDVSESTCSHARNKYLLDARPGTAERIPLPDNSVEIVVSFETIEHVPDPHCFLDECVRVLAPGGRLVISTPNKEIYAGRLGARNQYHCSEMTDEEFASALRAR